MGCKNSKAVTIYKREEEQGSGLKKKSLKQKSTNKQAEIQQADERRTIRQKEATALDQKYQKQNPVTVTDRKPDKILRQIIEESEQCLLAYTQKHQIDKAYFLLKKIENDIKELELRGYEVEMEKHFQQQFIRLSQIIKDEYLDVILFTREIEEVGKDKSSNGKWAVKKDTKGYKVSSRLEGSSIGILLEATMEVPFENFVAIMIQPNHYRSFLPFIKESKEVKKVAENCKIGTYVMQFPIIKNRQAYFLGTVFNRLTNEKEQEQEIFMYMNSIHDRSDLQKRTEYTVKMDPNCIPLVYRYVVLKYIPETMERGKIKLAVNIDLQLNAVPLSLLEFASVAFSKDFYDGVVKASKNFSGSVWEESVKSGADKDFYDFIRKECKKYTSKKEA